MGGQKLVAAALALLATATPAFAAPGAADKRQDKTLNLWDQCGGVGYTGPQHCGPGKECKKWNDWYYQCIPATTTSTSASATPTAAPSSSSSKAPLPSSTTSSAPSSSATPGVKYLITFGDSYSQTGFDITGTKPSPGNPLGNPGLPGWTASGGLNWVGFLTSQFNTSTLLTYNFAYGGATTNATLVQPWREDVLSLVDQFTQFSNSIASKPAYAPWTAENSLFGIWIGVNDVGNSWWKEDYDQLVDAIMDTYFRQLQIAYNAGARNFALLTVPPIHRTPAMQAESVEVQETEAVSIAKYNAAIATRLAAFKAANSGVVAKIVDTGAPFNAALDNPTAYGSPDALCYNGDGTSCLWFNDYHPGIEINRLVAKAVADAWKGSFF
ncbi:putative acylhydrolase [Podospora australis]|uniref:Acylhydrolase n=1 Tax=Podospora australis TaxID=1536484 RepID=A0AAN7AJD2_9PEZI|nr:putative acylhydrolase [Podospora australis]